MINVCLFREKKYKRSKTKLLEVVFRRKNYFLLFTKRNNASVIIKRILKPKKKIEASHRAMTSRSKTLILHFNEYEP